MDMGYLSGVVIALKILKSLQAHRYEVYSFATMCKYKNQASLAETCAGTCFNMLVGSNVNVYCMGMFVLIYWLAWCLVPSMC